MSRIKLFKRLGTQIMLIAMIALAATVIVILTVSLLMFQNYSNSIIVDRARIGMAMLEDALDSQLELLEERCGSLSGDSILAASLAARDTRTIQRIWDDSNNNDAFFFAVADEDGQLVVQSDNYPFSSFNLADVMDGKSYRGIVVDGNAMAAVYAASFLTNRIQGAMVVGLDMENTAWMETVKSIADCEVTVFKGNIRFATTIRDPSTGKPVVGTAMADNIQSVVLGSRQLYEGQATIFDVPYFVSYHPMYDVNGAVCGALFTGSNAIEVNQELSRVMLISILISVAALVITACILYFFTRRRVSVPIREVTVLAEEMESGRLSSTSVDYPFAGDEIGVFAGKLQDTKTQLGAYIQDISSVLSAMGRGDFTRNTGVEYLGDFTRIRQSFEDIQRRLAQIVGRMDSSADGVRNGAGQIADGSQLLAEGASRQATAIEELNSTVAGINEQISSTAENADRASMISSGCLEKVEEQNTQMTEMLSAMEDIREKSEKISSIIKTIEDIAFQTNILSLNASVEAARAGDAGKGFAVVADEVRNLAAKSGEAASNTNLLISDTVKAINEGVELAHRTAGIMSDVISQTQQTNEIIGEINVAAAAQAEAVTQVSLGISDISSVISQNSATAEETAASCQQLASQSTVLKEQVDMFKVNRV